MELPRNYEHALGLDKKNGTNLWQLAYEKEIYKVSISFDFLDHGVKALVSWKRNSFHIVWDVKMDFTRKAKWVKDGNKTPDPVTSNYDGVISRESVRIAFTYAALNNLDVVATDIQNSYLTTPSSEKYYVFCGTEFGEEHEGKLALIRRAL